MPVCYKCGKRENAMKCICDECISPNYMIMSKTQLEDCIRNTQNEINNFINDVINECLKWGIFNESLHNKYGILTSKGIQKRFIEATQRRTEVEFIKEYLRLEKLQGSLVEEYVKKYGYGLRTRKGEKNDETT